MSEIAQEHQEQLRHIKKNIEEAYEYFKPNYDRFHEYRKFIFNTSMSEQEVGACLQLDRPTIEANICEAYISRQRGEFSKQEPSVYVSPVDDAAGQVSPILLDILEGHIKAILNDSKKDDLEFDCYTDSLSGGFSCFQIRTDYIHPMSFKQKIVFERVFDPALCGFDPLARKSHKGDGRYCFTMNPIKRQEFIERYDKGYLEKINFTRNIEGFNWCYRNGDEDVVLICDYYEKKKQRKKIVNIVTGQTMTMKKYKEFVNSWIASGRIEAPPGIIGKPRYTEIETICRYRIIENQVLEYMETDYKYFPLVFVDGNSVYLRDNTNGSAYQMVRPYIYHLKGIQKLKNLSVQILASELENIPNANKLFIAKESLVPEYLDAITNPQKASSIVYRSKKEDDGSALPPPQPIPRQPAPPEIVQTIEICDKNGQAILGSYDAALGINNNQLSGIAIQEGATQSNATAMPYIVNFMKALNRVGEIILDLIPKYYIEARNISIMTGEGKRSSVRVNDRNGINLNYDSALLQIKVEAGVNFAIQKNRDMQLIEQLMQASPIFAKFMNEEGLPILLDNLEVKGIDQLKKAAENFMQQFKMQQQNQPPNPEMLKIQVKMKELQQEMQEMQQNYQLKATDLAIKKQAEDTNRIKTLAEIGVMTDKMTLEKDKVEAENTRTAVDSLLRETNSRHAHAMDLLKHHHQTSKENQEMI